MTQLARGLRGVMTIELEPTAEPAARVFAHHGRVAHHHPQTPVAAARRRLGAGPVRKNLGPAQEAISCPDRVRAAVADAICDRLFHRAHRLTLKGPTMRDRGAARQGLA